MGVVHSSTGSLKPASEFLRSEPSIIAELGKVVLGKRGDIPWEQMRDDYNVIRDHISDIIPGFENFNTIFWNIINKFRHSVTTNWKLKLA